MPPKKKSDKRPGGKVRLTRGRQASPGTADATDDNPSVKTFTLTPTQTLMTLIQTLMTLIQTLMINEVYLEERSSVAGDGHRAVTPAEHDSEAQTGGPEEASAHQVLFGFA